MVSRVVHVHEWCDNLCRYLEDFGIMWRKLKYSDDVYFYELYSGVALNSNATIWRVCVLYAPSSDSDIITGVHKEFIDLFFQTNVVRLIFATDRMLTDSVRNILTSYAVDIIDIHEYTSYTSLEEDIFRTLTIEALDNTLMKEVNLSYFGSADPDAILIEIIKMSRDDILLGASMLPCYLLQHTMDHGLSNSQTYLFEELFDVITIEHHTFCHRFIYPNRLEIQSHIQKWYRILEMLQAISTKVSSTEIHKCVYQLYRSLCSMFVSLLSVNKPSDPIEEFRDALAGISLNDILYIIAYDFENKPYDDQEKIIKALCIINASSDVSRWILIEGAHSRIQTVAILSLTLLAFFGFHEAMPTIEMLAQDRRRDIRELALRVLEEASNESRLLNIQGERIYSSRASGSLSIEVENEICKDMFPFASRHAFFQGKGDTVVSAEYFEDDEIAAQGTVHCAAGSIYLFISNRYSIYSHACEIIDGRIPEDTLRMGEAVFINKKDGSVQRFFLNAEEAAAQGEYNA